MDADQLTTQQVADRLGFTTAELCDLRLKDDTLPIIRNGFQLYYRLEDVKAFERRELLALIEKVLAADRPMPLIRTMAAATGLPRLKIAGQTIQPLKLEPAETATHRPPAPTDAKPVPLNAALPWFVVHTKPRQESVARTHLERQGFECYLPMMKVQQPRRHKLSVTEEPMFPRYLFIALDTSLNGKGWAPIRSTKGVSKLVRFGNRPAKVDLAILEHIRAREIEQHRDPEKPFKPGDRVRLADGPLAGLETIYQAENGEQRSMILLELLSRPVKVTVPTASLRKTG